MLKGAIASNPNPRLDLLLNLGDANPNFEDQERIDLDSLG